MADNKDKQEVINAPEKNEAISEQAPRVEQGVQESISENKEALRTDKLVTAELRKEIEMMELDDKTKGEAKAKAEKIEFLGEKEKVKHLLQMAREKGLVFAIRVARETNDPYLLDILHDTLVQEGFYKDFIK
jgi:hypothetical protein